MKAENGVDLSSEEDLAIGVMNLIALEEHLFFTASKTDKKEYLDLAKEVRSMRTRLMARMIPQNEGETWCSSKHLLSASMRLMEVGNKLYTSEDAKTKADGEMVYKDSYRLFSLFWALRLKLITLAEMKEELGGEVKPFTYEDLVSKMVDCCKE